MQMKILKIVTLGLIASATIAAIPSVSAGLLDPLDPVLDPIADLLGLKIEDYRETQQQLVAERKTLAESLRDKTPAERRVAILQYQETNAERIAAHRALGEEIREAVKDLRPERNPDEQPLERPVATDLPIEIRDLMDLFASTRDALLQERQKILDDYKDASEEDLRAALDQLKETIATQRQLARELQDVVFDEREDRRNR